MIGPELATLDKAFEGKAMKGGWLRAVLSGLAFGALLSACVGVPIADFDNAAILVNEDKILAFVGEKIAVVETEAAASDSGDPDEVVIVLDLAFEARYRVLEVIHGDYAGETVDFAAFDHYGFPQFARSKYALLYLVESGGRLYHWKYLFDPVYPTADGRFAGCGDPSPGDEGEPMERRPLDPIRFEPPVVFRLSEERVTRRRRPDLSAAERDEINREIESRFAPPVFDRRGDVATCRMGRYPEELFRIAYETRIQPARRRDLCLERLGSGGLKFDAEMQGKIAACVADLKANSAP